MLGLVEVGEAAAAAQACLEELDQTVKERLREQWSAGCAKIGIAAG
jgi:hypothetical protein